MPDPLVVLRQSEAELRAVDPWTRARLRMEAGERAEAAAAEEARRARVEQAEMRRAWQEMTDRQELVEQGFLSREAAAIHAEAVSQRQGRIMGLRQELAGR